MAAATSAIFVVYTALAGNGVAQLTPGEHDPHGQGERPVDRQGRRPRPGIPGDTLRFAVKDIGDKKPGRVFVDYRGSVPDLFGSGRQISVNGRLRHGVFAAQPNSLITKCPDHYAPTTSKT